MNAYPIFMNRNQVIAVISKLRQEWEEVAGGQSLVELKGSVGLMLADLVKALELSPTEYTEALGAELTEQLLGELVTQPGGNGNY